MTWLQKCFQTWRLERVKTTVFWNDIMLPNRWVPTYWRKPVLLYCVYFSTVSLKRTTGIWCLFHIDSHSLCSAGYFCNINDFLVCNCCYTMYFNIISGNTLVLFFKFLSPSFFVLQHLLSVCSIQSMPIRDVPINTNDIIQPKVINKCTLILKGSGSSILHISLKVSQL